MFPAVVSTFGVPTCSVTSHIHFDRRIACKIVQCGPLPWQRAVEKWYGRLSWQRAADRRGQRWKDMWEQQSSIRIWAGTRLHPDLGAARLGQDLPGPARILMLDCLFNQVDQFLLFGFPWLLVENIIPRQFYPVAKWQSCHKLCIASGYMNRWKRAWQLDELNEYFFLLFMAWMPGRKSEKSSLRRVSVKHQNRPSSTGIHSDWPNTRLYFFAVSVYCNPGNFRIKAINFRIVRKFLEFMKINSLLTCFPGLKCTVKPSQLWKLVAYEMPKSSIY